LGGATAEGGCATRTHLYHAVSNFGIHKEYTS
jgi:hypothetical protein